MKKIYEMKPAVSTILLLFVLCRALLSQPNVRFEEVHAVNNLSQNTVTSIHQDKLGFLWLGTSNGLNKYDGYRFKSFFINEDNKNAGINRINSIKEDLNGRLWIETYDGKFHRFNPETEQIRSFPDRDSLSKRIVVTNIYFSRDSVVWLSTDKTGIYAIKEVNRDDALKVVNITKNLSNTGGLSSDFVNFVVTDKNGNTWAGSNKGLNCILKGEVFNINRKIIHYFSGNPGDKNFSFSCAEVTDSSLFFGTQNNGLLVYNIENKMFEKADIPDPKINVIKKKGGIIWIGTSSGKVHSFTKNGKLLNTYSLTDDRSGLNIEKIHFDSHGSLWILTDNFGISKLTPPDGKIKYYVLTPTDKREKTDNERTIFFEDRDKNIWLGVLNMGLAFYMKEKDQFHYYSNNPDDPTTLVSDVIESIYQDREGTIWIGTSWFGKGLNKMLTIDPAFRYIQPVSNPSSKVQNMVRSLHEDTYGNMWVGTKNGKVYIYNRDYQLLHTISKNPSINYSGHNVYSVYQDSKNYIWLCTKGSGIFRSNRPLNEIYPNYQNISFINFRFEENNKNTLNNNNVYDIIEDKYGRYWIATYGGGINLLSMENGKAVFKGFTSENSNLSSNKTRDLYIDKRNRLWIGTTYGLNFIDLDGKDETGISSNLSWETNNNISYNDVLMIIEDDKQNIWVSTAGGGINKISSGGGNKFQVKPYTSKDGLKNDLTTSLIYGPDGNIWIGTEQGLSRYLINEDRFEIIDEQYGLPVLQFSERTNIKNKRDELVFGTVDGFYVIEPGNVVKKQLLTNISLTNFQLFNTEVKPGKHGSPLHKSISYTKEIILKHNQSIFAIEFSSLSFKSYSNKQYAYILDGFEKGWNKVGHENKATYTNIPPGEYTFRVKTANGDNMNEEEGASLKITIKPPLWLSPLAYVIYVILVILVFYITLKIVYRFTRLKNNIRVERKVAESKLRFFTNISHEIRTPLTLILGPVENLFEITGLSHDVKNQLDIIHKNSKRLLRTVNQLLDFRKIQNEKMKVNVQQFDLVELVKTVYESFEGLALQKEIDFTYNSTSNNIFCYGDVQQLDIVLFNLLSNAFKFTPQYRSITIDLNDTGDDGHIVIKVTDTGVGIPEDKLPFIFDRFFVSHTNVNDKLHGTGIGLSLVYEYIKLHKGEITVNSRPDKGTIFTIKLKKGIDHLLGYGLLGEKTEKINHDQSGSLSIEHGPGESEEPGPYTDTNSPAVLIIEDDPDMGEYLLKMLSERYKTEYARNGKEGVSLAKKLIPDIIISDIMMPEMDGYELLQQLKSDFNTSHIPVIMLTAKSAIEDHVEGFEKGAEAFISKPFNKKILLSNIQTLISQRALLHKKFDNIVDLKPDQIKVVSKDKVFIENVIEYINESMEDPDFNVEKLVGKMNVSRTLFYKKITSLTGNKPVELIREIRLKKAYQILETGEYNISEAAIMVGFNDIRYFSTCFKKYFGINPSKILVKTKETFKG